MKVQSAKQSLLNARRPGRSILVLVREFEYKQFSSCFEAYSRLFSYPLFFITFVGVVLVLTALQGKFEHGDDTRLEHSYYFKVRRES
jgi:hypothetical protein